MDAPKGRYRVEEKDGRLVVIDTLTGAPISSPGIPPPGASPRAAGPVAPRSPALVDLIARPLLRLAVSRTDDSGRAVIAWEWTENGRTRRWDATLDPAQQRRLGRALLAFAALPLTVVASIVFGGAALWLLPVALPATLLGAASVARLRRQTSAGN
jgi:hypothetical protein